MSFGSQTISQKDQKILSLSVNQSSAGLAIPIIWGKTRVPSNMLDYVDFKAIEHTETQGSSGKGGDVKQTSTTYTYQAAMILALGAGEISAVGKVWDDKSVTGLSALGLELKSGAVGQSPWAYMSAHHPERALGYSGIAYVAGAAFDLRSSASTPSLSFEVSGRGVVGNGVEDAGGWTVITDLLTDPYIGAGVPSSMLGDLSDYTAYCKAMGLYVSPALTSQTSCSSVLSDLMTATLSEVVESEGKIKVIPYGDEPVGSWVPNSTPVVDLDEGSFLDQDAPLSVRRKRPADAYNEVSVEYLDRDNDYNTAIYTAQDQAAIDRFGRRPKGQTSLHSICDGGMAQAVAQHILQREANLCNEYVFRLDHRFAYLEPMDLITLSFAAKGLDKLPVRIKDVEVSDNFEIEVTCEEWPFGIATPARFSVQNNSGFSQNTNVTPGNANSPVIFEPPLSLSGSPEIWIGTSGGEHWGGADVWVSLDNATYSKVGTIKTSARHGILTAALPSGSDPDNTNALAVDLSVSGGTLTPATTAARDMMQTLLYAGGELVAYAGATLTGPCQYSLTGLRRGCYGSTIGAHATGQKAMRLDDGVFRYPYDPATTVGKTLYIKLQSRNKFGAALQDLANLTAYTYTVAGVPLGSVAGLMLETPFTGLVFAAKWTASPGATRYQLDFYNGATLKKTLYTSDTRVELTVDKLIAMGLGRSVTLKLTAISANGQSSTPAVLAATKAQLAAPTISVQDTGGSMIVTASQSADAAYKATRICISQTSGFDPASTTPYYDGPQTAYPSPTLASGTWYVRACQYDLFGADSLNWTSQVAVSVTSLASGVQRVADASTITGTVGGNPPGGDAYWAVYDSKTGKMARWDKATGLYVFAISADDIAGALSDAQIAELAASKIIGAITTTQITDGAISAPKIAAGAVTAKHLLITDFENLFKDPNGATGATTLAGVLIVSTTSGTAYQCPANVRDTVASDGFPISPGDQYWFSATFQWVSGGTVPTALGFMMRGDDGGIVAWVSGCSCSTVDGTWVTVSGFLTVPATARRAYVWWQRNGANGTSACGVWNMRNVQIRRKNAGDLIVDGAITTEKLSADAVTADKIAANTITAAEISAGAVTADKLAVAQLSAISASLGTITAGVLEFTGGAGWSYIRTPSKWWGDTVNGWVQASKPSTSSYFHEFRAASGSAIVLERRGNGADVGGMAYLSYVKDSSGVERFVIDPANGVFKLRGRIEALEGSFAGSLEAASGTLGTITAGLLKNSTDTTRFNLSETGSNEVIRINGATRVWGDGRTNWANSLTPSGLSVTFNKIIFSTTVGDYGSTSYTTEASILYDTGIVYDALNDAYNADFTATVVAYGMTMYGTWSAANIAPANVHIELQRLQPIPVATGQSWGSQTVKFLITASVDGFPSAYTNTSWWLRLDSLIIKVFKRT